MDTQITIDNYIKSLTAPWPSRLRYRLDGTVTVATAFQVQSILFTEFTDATSEKNSQVAM